MKVAVLLATSLFFSASTYAEGSHCVKTSGQSDFNSQKEDTAKLYALKDAVKNAMLTRNLRVTSDSKIENFQLQNESTSFVSHAAVSKVTPISFRVDEDLEKGSKTYIVTAETCFIKSEEKCGRMDFIQPKVAILIPRVHSGNAPVSNGFQEELKQTIKTSLKTEGLADITTPSVTLPSAYPSEMSSYDIQPYLSGLESSISADYAILPIVSLSSERKAGWLDGMRKIYGHELEDNLVKIKSKLILLDLQHNSEPLTTTSRKNVGAGSENHMLKAVHELSGKLAKSIACKNGVLKIIEAKNTGYLLNKGALSGIKIGDLFSAPAIETKASGEKEFLKVTRTTPNTSFAEPQNNKNSFEVGAKLTSWIY